MSERIESLCAALSLTAIGRDYANLADEAGAIVKCCVRRSGGDLR